MELEGMALLDGERYVKVILRLSGDCGVGERKILLGESVCSGGKVWRLCLPTGISSETAIPGNFFSDCSPPKAHCPSPPRKIEPLK